MFETITCPSGLTGRIRGMKVREERILADRKLAKGGEQVDALLAACWEETVDSGPYDFGEGGIDWGQVLQGDRFYALLQIRALTYGPTYAFALGCQNEACRSRFEWELDLHDLPVRALSDESRAAFTNGNRFETTLPDAGKRVGFRLFTGADERKLPQLRRNAGDRILSAILAWRILDIEGITGNDKRRALEDLSLRDADFLVGEFDRVDCGVDTAIELGLVLTTGQTRGTRYYVEPELLRDAGLDTQTTLARIQPHRLRTLIMEDLERFPDSGRADIHRRIGSEINAKTITRTLNELRSEGLVVAEGDRRWRTYRLADSKGQSP